MPLSQYFNSCEPDPTRFARVQENYSSWKHQATILVLFLMHGGSLFIIHHTVSNDVCSKWCAYSSHNDHHLAQQANMSAFKFKFQYHLLLRGFPIDSCLPPQEEGYPLYPIQTLSWCLHQWPILNLFWPAKWEFLSGKDVPLFIELGGYTGEYQLLN